MDEVRIDARRVSGTAPCRQWGEASRELLQRTFLLAMVDECLGRTRPSSRKREPGLACSALVSSGMNASVHSQVLAGHKAGGLEVKHGLDNIRDLAHPRDRMELPQRIVIVASRASGCSQFPVTLCSRGCRWWRTPMPKLCSRPAWSTSKARPEEQARCRSAGPPGPQRCLPRVPNFASSSAGSPAAS